MGKDKCVFCEIVKGEEEANIVNENSEYIAFLALNPYGRGHTLVIPKKHYKNIFDFPDSGLEGYFKFIKETSKKLKEKIGCEGVNILNASGEEAQQSVFHLHFHIVPRFKDDGMNMEPKEAFLWDGKLEEVKEEVTKD